MTVVCVVVFVVDFKIAVSLYIYSVYFPVSPPSAVKKGLEPRQKTTRLLLPQPPRPFFVSEIKDTYIHTLEGNYETA